MKSPTVPRKKRGPNRVHVCPLCSEPVRPRQSWISLGAVRHHLSCARKAGLAQENRGRRVSTARSGDGAARITVRLSAAENEHAETLAARRLVTVPELCRLLLATTRAG